MNKRTLGLMSFVLFVSGYFLGQSSNEQVTFFENDPQTQKVLQEVLNRPDVSVFATVYESVGGGRTRMTTRFNVACLPARFFLENEDTSRIYSNPENGIWFRINGGCGNADLHHWDLLSVWMPLNFASEIRNLEDLRRLVAKHGLVYSVRRDLRQNYHLPDSLAIRPLPKAACTEKVQGASGACLMAS